MPKIQPTDTKKMMRRFWKELAWIFGIPILFILALVYESFWRPDRRFNLEPGESIWEIVEGRWDWAGTDSTCEGNPHIITFSSDTSLMIIKPVHPWVDSAGVADSVAEYDIQEHDQNHIRGKIRGEKRLDEKGDPVIWDLVLVNRNAYHWHRVDWFKRGYTSNVVRCPEPES